MQPKAAQTQGSATQGSTNPRQRKPKAAQTQGSANPRQLKAKAVQPKAAQTQGSANPRQRKPKAAQTQGSANPRQRKPKAAQTQGSVTQGCFPCIYNDGKLNYGITQLVSGFYHIRKRKYLQLQCAKATRIRKASSKRYMSQSVAYLPFYAVHTRVTKHDKDQIRFKFHNKCFHLIPINK